LTRSEAHAERRSFETVRVSAMILVYRYRVKSLNGLLNKQSRAVVWNFIGVGNRSASKLARTRLAKSVYDASWWSFHSRRRAKAGRRG
jgi:hypothetical protein